MTMLTKEQLAMRMTGIGGSEIADVVLGSGMRTWMRKTGRAEEDVKPVTLQGRIPREMGHRLEPVIADLYADETGASIFTPPAETATVRHPRHPIALATPDRLAKFPSLEVVLEAKAPGLRMAPEWESGVPEGYQLQAIWLCGVLELPRCDVAALIGGQDFRIYPIDARPDDFAGLVEIAERFWRDHVEKDVPPAVDGSDEWSSYIAKRFPRQKAGLVLKATPADVEEIAELRAVRARQKADKARGDELKNRIALRMGEAEGIEGLCTYRLQKGSTFQVTKAPGRVLRLANGED